MCFEACYGIHTGGFNPSEKIFVKLDHLAGWKMNNVWNQHRVTTIFVRLVLGCYHLISITRLGGCALFARNARQHVHLSQWVGDLNRYFGPMRFGWLVFFCIWGAVRTTFSPKKFRISTVWQPWIVSKIVSCKLDINESKCCNSFDFLFKTYLQKRGVGIQGLKLKKKTSLVVFAWLVTKWISNPQRVPREKTSVPKILCGKKGGFHGPK